MVVKPLLESLPPLVMALARFLLAALVLVPIGLRQAGPLPGPATVLALGFFGVGAFYLCFNVGLQFTTASAAALIQGAGPAITAVAAFVLLGERLRAVGILGLVVSAVGVAMIVAGSGQEGEGAAPLLGGLLIFGSATSWALYTVICRRLTRYPPLRLTAAGAAVGTLLLVPMAAVELSLVGPGAPTWESWLAVIYLGLGPSAAAYLLWSYGLQRVSANEAGSLLNLIPVLALVLAALVLGEQPAPAALAGGALVLLGVWLTTRRGRPASIARPAAGRAEQG